MGDWVCAAYASAECACVWEPKLLLYVRAIAERLHVCVRGGERHRKIITKNETKIVGDDIRSADKPYTTIIIGALQNQSVVNKTHFAPPTQTADALTHSHSQQIWACLVQLNGFCSQQGSSSGGGWGVGWDCVYAPALANYTHFFFRRK